MHDEKIGPEACSCRKLHRAGRMDTVGVGEKGSTQLIGSVNWQLLACGHLGDRTGRRVSGSAEDSVPSSSSQSTYEEDELQCSYKRQSSVTADSAADELSKHHLVVFYPHAATQGNHSSCCYCHRCLRVRLTPREKFFSALTALSATGFCILGLLLLSQLGHPITTLPAAPATSEPSLCLTEACVETAGTLIKNMDRAADPCENFFQYSCGGFNKHNVISEDKTSIGSIDILVDDLYITIKDLLEGPHSAGDWVSVTKAKDMYATCTDKGSIEEAGDMPLRGLLTALGGWPLLDERTSSRPSSTEPSNASLAPKEVRMAAIASQLNIPILLSVSVEVDDQNSSAHVIQIRQPAHIGMMSRDYYIDREHQHLAAVYFQYMAGITRLLLNSTTLPNDAAMDLEDIYTFEKSLAEIMLPEGERFEKNVNHVKITLAELMHSYPGFDWSTYLAKVMPVPIKPSEELYLHDVKYIKNMVRLLKRANSRTVINYLMWRIAMTYAEELSSSYEHIDFQFKKVLYGYKSPEARWRKCLKYVSRHLDMVVGAMLARSEFGKDSLLTANELITNLRGSFHEMVAAATWMDEETKTMAHVKAKAMNEKIGYPEYILNGEYVDSYHEQLEVTKDDYFQNLLNVERFQFLNKAMQLRQSVDAKIWRQPITEVNAFYDPNGNEMVFPAGIWQPPFFSSKYPRSMIYGGIGVVIGHEITHGFDSKGRLHDKDGNIREWWTNSTRLAFAERSKCMEMQYSGTLVDQVAMPVDGRNTLSENIADNGGVKEAFLAYQKWVTKHGPERRLPGLNLSGEQLFFVNYAQIWCGNVRNEQLVMDLKISEHSPGSVRTNLPLANLDAFADAFKCPVGSIMNPVHKCTLWLWLFYEKKRTRYWIIYAAML